jgi:hypothetical protein
MNQQELEMRRAAVELLLSGKIKWRRRQNVRRALDQAGLIPADAYRWKELYEPWITCCMDAAKVEQLERLLRRTLH